MGSLVKSLELQGYKTFATSTEFRFADTVTAIVGPNGSGKSNIVDALRWVLGEQSYSLLRGKKTEDMIFAGSEQRARAGMAAATLTFNNESGWLPIDFSEVAITRRAYRDGQNEYVLNGQRVRLKDVSELLSKSGLAERTYTIIGQGLVDAALSLKAEERRRLFEEAAGIGLYRSRREEAFRRLETTQRNIERIHDILTELRPHLRSLERQAEKAREYERMKTDLRILLRDWYGYHWHRAQNELLQARELSLEKEIILENSRSEQERIDTQLGSLRRAITEVREKLRIRRRKFIDLQTEREKLLREIAVADERLRSIEEQSEIVQSEIFRSGTEVEQREKLLNKAIDYLEQQEVEFTEVKTQLTSAVDELHAAQAARLESENKLIGVRTNLSELQARRSYLEATLVGYSGQVELKTNELTTVGISLNTIEDKYLEHKNKLDQSLEELEKVKNSKARLEEKVRLLDDEKQLKENSINELEKLQNNLVNEQARLQSEIELLAKGTPGLTKGARIVIENADLLESGDQLGLLRESLIVPDRYRTAIAAALGDYMDIVILKDDKKLDEILDMLQVAGVRGALVPLNKLGLKRNRFALTDKIGVIGYASELVNYSPNIHTVVELLLGGVILVDNRKAAKQLVADHSSDNDRNRVQTDDLRVVTLDGEVFYSSGLILGGRYGQGGGLGIDQQVAKLENELITNKENLVKTKDLMQTEQASLDKLNNQEVQLKQELNDLNNHEGQIRKIRDRTAIDIERISAHREMLKEQNVSLEAAVQDDGRQIPGIKEELSHLDGLISKDREFISQKESEIEKIYPLLELQDHVTRWKTKSAVLERGIEDANRQIEERRAISERANADFAALHKRMTDLESSKIDIQKLKEKLVENEIIISQEILDLSGLIESAEHSLLEQESQQQDLLMKDSQARQAHNLAEHQYAQSRINHAQKQESLETLKHRIEDDFGLVEFEYSNGISGPRPLPIDGMVEQLPVVEELSADIEDELRIQRASLRRLGAINPEAQAEFHDINERFKFLTEQTEDLHAAETDIRDVITELDELMRREFHTTFNAVADEFGNIFTRLFGGGSARLVLTNPDDLTETGIDIEAKLPGRREQGLSLLSGGERSLAATSLVFALLKVSPTPFCVLDEVDAMLDESNTGRFRDLLDELSQNTQFVVITHNRNTVQVADVIYGITMGRDSSSQIISLKMDEVIEAVG